MADVVDEYERAVASKQTLEEEMEALAAELTSGTNPGLKGPLVDSEGFPRADIDVYRVRHLRHELAVKTTDHKETMKKIEELLPRVFEVKFGASKVEEEKKEEKEEKVDVAAVGMQRLEIEWGQKMLEVSSEERQLQPFARVDSVERESPAEAARLQTQDQVLRFGSADATNHRELAAVRDIVQRNIGGTIRVVVRRQEQELALVLTPQSWRGPGVLGCLLLPM